MKISKGKRTIASSARVLSGSFEMAMGLRFKEPKPLIFHLGKSKKVILDMLFVFSPIDVIFLDKGKKVIEIKRNLRPFSFYKTKKKSYFVIELPLGGAKGVDIGDKLTF